MKPMRVKDAILDILRNEGPTRYSEFIKKLGKSDKTIYVSLQDLKKQGLITQDEEGRYVVTEKGKMALEEITAVERFRELYRRNWKLALKLLEEAEKWKNGTFP